MAYKYRFPAYGDIGGRNETQEYTQMLETNLRGSSDSLINYFLFPKSDNILDKVTFDKNDKGKVTAMTLYTNEKLYEGMESDLKNCVEDNIAATSQEYFNGQPKGIIIEGDVKLITQTDVYNVTPTYKYQFPASGKADDAPTFTVSKLEKELTNSPDCLMAYCIFPSDSEILDHVSFETDGQGNINALNLHTYTQLWGGMETDLRNCVEENLAKVTQAITIDGDVKAFGMEGKIPEKLYHIAEKKILIAL